MLENYLPVIVFMVMGVLFGLGPIAIGFILGPHKPDPEKNSHMNVVSKPLKTQG